MQNKLLFAGPVGAGKTTAISTISDAKPVGTEVPLTNPVGDKVSTTVALDYSYVNLGGEVLNLYGLPGQNSLSFMGEILIPGALGVILLLDSTSPAVYADALSWLSSIKKVEEDLQFVIGVTKTDIIGDFSMNALREKVNIDHPNIPIRSIDARDKASVKAALEVLMITA